MRFKLKNKDHHEFPLHTTLFPLCCCYIRRRLTARRQTHLDQSYVTITAKDYEIGKFSKHSNDWAKIDCSEVNNNYYYKYDNDSDDQAVWHSSIVSIKQDGKM
jgi:hypothetical protein